MLVFTRRVGESIVINGDIAVTIVRVGPNDVRIGIEAPSEMPIVRDDVTQDPPLDDEAEGAEHRPSSAFQWGGGQ